MRCVVCELVDEATWTMGLEFLKLVFLSSGHWWDVGKGGGG